MSNPTAVIPTNNFTPAGDWSAIYNQMATPIVQQGQANVADAESSALSRGLGGANSPEEGQLIANAQNNTQNNLAALNANLNMTGEQQGYNTQMTQEQQAFAAQMAAQQHQWDVSASNTGWQRQLIGGAGTAIGGYLGGPGGAALGGSLGNMFRGGSSTPSAAAVPQTYSGGWNPTLTQYGQTSQTQPLTQAGPVSQVGGNLNF